MFYDWYVLIIDYYIEANRIYSRMKQDKTNERQSISFQNIHSLAMKWHPTFFYQKILAG